jgi:hypothetical protein
MKPPFRERTGAVTTILVALVLPADAATVAASR